MPRHGQNKPAPAGQAKRSVVVVGVPKPKPKQAAAPSATGKMFRSGGEKAGAVIGRQLLGNLGLGELGNTLGKSLGGLAGGGISKILGFGDYYESNTVGDLLKHVASGGDPALFKVPTGTQAPSFRSTSGGTRVAHREYVEDMVVPPNPVAFSNDVHPINPGDPTLFPWLNKIAAQFQQYKIHGMVVVFEPLTSEVATGGPMGSVCLATNYNVLEPEFNSVMEALNSEFAVSAKPSKAFMHMLECAPKSTPTELLYVRGNTLPGGINGDGQADARLYDFGNLQVMTEGLAGTEGQVLGRIMIAYDIEFFKPRLSNSVITHWILANGEGNTVDKLGPYGIGPGVAEHYLGQGLAWESSVVARFRFTGPFMMIIQYDGTGFGASTTSIKTSGNTRLQNLWSYTASTTSAIRAWAGEAEAGDLLEPEAIPVPCTTLTNLQIWVFPGADAVWIPNPEGWSE